MSDVKRSSSMLAEPDGDSRFLGLEAMDYNRPDARLLLATIGQRTQQGTEVLKNGVRRL